MFSGSYLRKLIFPLIIEQFLGISVGMVDTMMISSVGESAVSGVSLVDMLNILFINIFAALATGGAVVVSQFIGAKKEKEANESASQLITISLLISLLIMALLLVFKHGILRLMFGKIDEDVMSHALIYCKISAISYPFIALYNSGAALFRSMGNSKVTMLVSLIANILNAAGNAMLIYVFNWGVAGAAIASAAARFVSMAVVLILLLNKKRQIHISVKSMFKIDLMLVKKILHIGIPSSMENSVFQLGRILVVSIIASFGTVQIAANAVANNLDGLGCIPGQAINLAMITVVGQCMGAGDWIQARKYATKLLKVTYICAAVWNGLIVLTLPLTLKAYNLSGETLHLAATLVMIHNLCAIVFWPLSFTLPNALRAANDVKYTMVISIFSMCTFRIVLSYIIGKWLGMGAIGVWISMIIDWIFRAAMFSYRFRGTKWLTHRIE